MGAEERRVADVMQKEVVSLGRDDHLDLADDVMRLGRIRHMPVLEGGRVVGIVSSRDLLAASLSRALDFDPLQRRTFLRSVAVSEVMSDQVVSVAGDAGLKQAAELMAVRQIGCLPVVAADGSFAGLVTETDLLRAALLSDEAGSAGAPDSWVERELDGLRRVRDELRVQVHLAGAEARERWEELERKFQEAESKARLVAREAEKPAQELGEALRLLLQEIRDCYRNVKDAL
jgi:CBS domain-containing membrane protein